MNRKLLLIACLVIPTLAYGRGPVASVETVTAPEYAFNAPDMYELSDWSTTNYRYVCIDGYVYLENKVLKERRGLTQVHERVLNSGAPMLCPKRRASDD